MDPKDAAFLQDMIAHHEAALGMARRYLDTASPVTRQARIARLASDVITAQTAEIAKMRGWLRAAGRPTGGGGEHRSM